MECYCGIDLHAKFSQVAVIDDSLSVLMNKKLPNDIGVIVESLESLPDRPRIVVESTFNWYWLVDGLDDAGFEVVLAHTLGLSMITKSRVKTDKRDAIALAKLLRIGAIPQGYIYPRGTRPIRDLIRRRTGVVVLRAKEYAGLRRLLYQEGLHNHSRNSIRQMTEDDLDHLFGSAEVRMTAAQELERIELYNEQIHAIESHILKHAKGEDNYARLLQVPGLGKALAAVVCYETGEISRFSSARCYSSYSRVVPGAADSGGKHHRGRGSKQGNPHLKSAFGQAAVHAVRCYPAIRRFFDRQMNRRRGRARTMISYSIVSHKIAQASYYVMKKGTNYQEKLLFGN